MSSASFIKITFYGNVGGEFGMHKWENRINDYSGINQQKISEVNIISYQWNSTSGWMRHSNWVYPEWLPTNSSHISPLSQRHKDSIMMLWILFKIARALYTSRLISGATSSLLTMVTLNQHCSWNSPDRCLTISSFKLAFQQSQWLKNFNYPSKIHLLIYTHTVNGGRIIAMQTAVARWLQITNELKLQLKVVIRTHQTIGRTELTIMGSWCRLLVPRKWASPKISLSLKE